MTKVNVQCRLPEELMRAVEQVAPRSKSEFIRDAIQEKLRRERDRMLEKQWIESLQLRSDTEPADRDWLTAEAWETR